MASSDPIVKTYYLHTTVDYGPLFAAHQVLWTKIRKEGFNTIPMLLHPRIKYF